MQKFLYGIEKFIYAGARIINETIFTKNRIKYNGYICISFK